MIFHSKVGENEGIEGGCLVHVRKGRNGRVEGGGCETRAKTCSQLAINLHCNPNCQSTSPYGLSK
jgi:hypothetical protein